jgi:hypothetical protein
LGGNFAFSFLEAFTFLHLCSALAVTTEQKDSKRGRIIEKYYFLTEIKEEEEEERGKSIK